MNVYTHLLHTLPQYYFQSFYLKEPIDLQPGIIGPLEAYNTGLCVLY